MVATSIQRCQSALFQVRLAHSLTALGRADESQALLQEIDELVAKVRQLFAQGKVDRAALIRAELNDQHAGGHVAVQY